MMKKQILISASVAAMFGATPVLATEMIAFQLGVYDKSNNGCDLCHTNANINTADKPNLMPAAKTAYNQDKFGLSGLKSFLASANSATPVVPTCTNGQVLNVAKTACETPKAVTPTCTGNTVLNATKDACVALPAPIVTPTKPTTSSISVVSETTKNTKPVLNQIATQSDAVVGETLVIPLSVQDTEHDAFKILSTSGLKFSNIYIDATTQLPTIDLLWTPSEKQVNTIQTLSFQAKETRAKSPLTSNKVSTRIRVWANENRDMASITRLNVGTYALKNGKVNLSGSVTFSNLVTSAERSAFIAKKLPLTVSDSTGVILSTMPLTLDDKGNWSVSFSANLPSCDIVLAFEGQKAARTLANCTVAKATSAQILNPVLVASRENDFEHEHEHHDEHDD